MKIETKFSVGDVGHFIDENRLQQATVSEIIIRVAAFSEETRVHIDYKLTRFNHELFGGNTIAEHLLFPTKETLVDNLYKQD